MRRSIEGVGNIVAVDLVSSRIELAKELGATVGLDSTPEALRRKSLGEVLKGVTPERVRMHSYSRYHAFGRDLGTVSGSSTKEWVSVPARHQARGSDVGGGLDGTFGQW